MTTDNRTNEQIVVEALGRHNAGIAPGYTANPFNQAGDVVAALDAAGRLQTPGGQLSGNTGQFTEAQVEAAAKVLLRDYQSEYDGGEVSEFLDVARAALVAAQGAEPQAESADCDRDRMGICKRCGMGWDARKVLDGDFACPVLPSSGVDEVRAEAVREVARYINRIAPNGLVPKKMILADMEFAADRLGRGIHANGNDRAVQVGESRGE